MPRSYSRDLADRYAGGGRQYYRKWNTFETWKILLSRGVIVGVAIWAAVAAFGGPKTEYHVTHGPLANVHAAWDSQCDTCHRPQGFSSGSLLDAHSRWHDLSCEKCHAGSQHHDNISNEEKRNKCADCHHDHGGRFNSLVKISDDHCTRCHVDTKSYMKDPSKPVWNVTRFVADPPVDLTRMAKPGTGDHPDFAPFQNHIRHLKFSHSVHLTPGMIYEKGTPANAWTLKDLVKIAPERAAEFKQFENQTTKLIQLNCQACHQAAPGGKTFQPIKFEQHCAMCHPNTVPNIASTTEQVFPPFAVPHGKQPDEYKPLVEAQLSRVLQQKNPDLVKTPLTKTLPPAVVMFTAEVKATSDKALHMLFDAGAGRCAKCHDYSAGQPGPVPEKIVPPNIPTIWLTKAKFDHTAHRVADCTSCHPASVSMLGTEAHKVEKTAVDILGIASCQQCHAPQKTVNGKLTGGIRHDCTECHPYHSVDHPMNRLQDALIPQKSTGSFEAFMNGRGRE